MRPTARLKSTYGHDAFLVEVEEQTPLIRHFLEKTYYGNGTLECMESKDVRLDHRIIFDIIEPGSSVLDLGCGTGDLIYLLTREKNVRVQGIELDERPSTNASRRGSASSTAISRRACGISRPFLRLRDPEPEHAGGQEGRLCHRGSPARGGEGHRRLPQFRVYQRPHQLFFQGKAPMTPSLPYRWYDTPNVRFLSISDFRDFCREKRSGSLRPDTWMKSARSGGCPISVHSMRFSS